MKALLLSGGHGTRLRPLTHTQSKQLLPIANRPILFYGLDAIARTRISDVGIIVGDTEEEIREAVGDGSNWDLNVTYIRQEAPLGLAHAVLIAKEFIKEDPFLMYLGDNLVRDDLARFIEMFDEHEPDAQIFLVKVPHPEHFGVAVVEDEKIHRLVEKPTSFVSDLALSGVYIFTSAIFQAAASITPSNRGELEITDAIQQLIDHGYHVRAEHISGWWKDTGKVEDLLEANRFVLEAQERDVRGDVDDLTQMEGAVRLGEGSVIRDSIIRGPATIGAGCRIEHAVIDRFTSVDDGSVIIDTQIGNSIVMKGAWIERAPTIRDSLIGRNVRVFKASERSAIQLMLGDNSGLVL